MQLSVAGAAAGAGLGAGMRALPQSGTQGCFEDGSSEMPAFGFAGSGTQGAGSGEHARPVLPRVPGGDGRPTALCGAEDLSGGPAHSTAAATSEGEYTAADEALEAANDVAQKIADDQRKCFEHIAGVLSILPTIHLREILAGKTMPMLFRYFVAHPPSQVVATILMSSPDSAPVFAEEFLEFISRHLYLLSADDPAHAYDALNTALIATSDGPSAEGRPGEGPRPGVNRTPPPPGPDVRDPLSPPITAETPLACFPPHARAATVVRLCRLVLYSLAKVFRVHDRILVRFISSLLVGILGSMPGCKRPVYHLSLLRQLFKQVANSRSDHLFRAFPPHLPLILDSLLACRSTMVDPELRDQCTELLLIVPARLSHQLKWLPRLMGPLILALRSRPSP